MKTDLQLQQDVMDELKWDPSLADFASQIGVSSNDGIITLSGHVDTYLRKHAAETAAQRVRGVSFVAVDIDVTLGVKIRPDDFTIAKTIKETLKQLSILDYEKLDVKVDDGNVKLDGTLQWNYQRQAAEEAIRTINGVRSVNNRIELSDEPCDSKAISEKISAAFHRHATLDAADIRVQIKGRKAVLSGKVRSWIEKKDAENVAWSSPGIKAVENNIIVKPSYGS